MNFSIKRVNSIFIKDWKDLQKNNYILFTLAIPLVFAVWLGRIGAESAIYNTYPIILSLVLVGSLIQAAMVAEEKEKNTLRGLILSPASTTEIFLGKCALSAILASIVIIASVFLSGYNVPSPPLFSVSVLLGLAFYLAIGTIIGLISRTVMDTSIIGVPVLLIFGISFKSLVENETALMIINYLPNEALNTIWVDLNNGKGFSGIIENILILLAWVVISIVTTVIIYRKRRVD
ncbi:ABC transporter permease [Bacillus spongiae]|uniref:ABC transporter permease n=2 Tax=Bacillus spongiae TaxID=2683610 RepID=A0ABU8HAG3_9BACI